ncbi:hypothetical protein Tco_0526217 [Tanacetum coccineum]
MEIHGFIDTIDIKTNGEALRKCILIGPYTPTIVTTPAVPATEDSPPVPEQITQSRHNENPLFNEMGEDDENENSNVSNSDELVFLNTPLTDKVECFDPKDNIDEIDAFLTMEVSSNFEEGYYDSEGDVIFLESLLSDDTTHNLSPEVIFDHEPKQNESIHNTSITFFQEVILFTMSSPEKSLHFLRGLLEYMRNILVL